MKYVDHQRVMWFLNYLYQELVKIESETRSEDIGMLTKSMSIEMDYLDGKIPDKDGFVKTVEV